MISILLGALGAVITVFGIQLTVPPQAVPVDQLTLPAFPVNGIALGDKVQVEPVSELKFKNIARQVYDYSCGSAALVTVLQNHIGLPVTEQQAMEGMLAHGESDKIIARRGFSLLDMKRFVSSIGLEGNGFRGELSDLRSLTAPVIVPIEFENFKHFVVLRGIRGGRVFLADPALGHLVVSESEFAAMWDRNTLFLITPPKDKMPLNLLALTTRELGVFDADLIRSDAVLRITHNNDVLLRALETQQGIATWR
jgi:predicted double-glycine peptidase